MTITRSKALIALLLMALAAHAQQVPKAALSASTLSQWDDEMATLASRTLPAVVQISVTGFGPSTSVNKGEDVIERQRGIGSGVIVDPEGYIMTNAHVIAGAQRINVVLRSITPELIPAKTSLLQKQRTFHARVIGVHAMTDLALLKIEATGLPFIALPQTYRARLGQGVLALGSPEGLDQTVTRGIVSAVGRQPDPANPMIYIQTDAPINRGNSGGPLVDKDGHLIGINTFIYSQSGGSQGLGFAIPEPTVRFVYNELREHGKVRRTIIGAQAQTITPSLANGLRLPQDWGVIISDITPGGPAEAAGVKRGDIVISIDDRRIDSLPIFAASLFLHSQDRPVSMTVRREGQFFELVIPAAQEQSPLEALSNLVDPKNSLISNFGIFAVDLDKKVSELLPGLRSLTGVVVAGRLDFQPAVESNLAVGDVIRSINRESVASVNALNTALARFKPGDAIVLEVERQGVIRYQSVEME